MLPCSAPVPVQFGKWKMNSNLTSSVLLCNEGFKSEVTSNLPVYTYTCQMLLSKTEISCECSGGSWCCGAADVSQGCVPACSDLPAKVQEGDWDCGSDSSPPYTRCRLQCNGRRGREGNALCGLRGVWTLDSAHCSDEEPGDGEDLQNEVTKSNY